MSRRTISWQERQLRDEEFRNKMTCPVCGTKAKEFANITALPTSGFIGHGQWYCSRKHWAEDPNSSFHTNPRYSHYSRLYKRFEELRKQKERITQ